MSKMIVFFMLAPLAATSLADEPLLVPQVRSFKASDRALPSEGYRIRIGADGKAAVEAADEAGRFYAV